MSMAEEKDKQQESGDKPGSFDTSEATNVTKTLEEANEAGYLGASFSDEDLTVEGVTSKEPAAGTDPVTGEPLEAKGDPSEPGPTEAKAERKSKRGE